MYTICGKAFRAAIGLFSHILSLSVSISPPTRDLQGGMSWSSSYRMDERTNSMPGLGDERAGRVLKSRNAPKEQVEEERER